MTSQEDLAALWLNAPEDRLCGREQAKAWALREVWRADGKGKHGMLTFIASKLQKTKDSLPQGDPPGVSALSEFFEKIDDDPNWFPGKHSEATRGPKRILRGVKVTALKNAVKRLRADDDEATYSEMVARCPEATRNPDTGEPVDKKLIYRFFREECHDEGASDYWDHVTRVAQAALDGPAMARRIAFGNHMSTLRHTAAWFCNNVVLVCIHRQRASHCAGTLIVSASHKCGRES